MKKIEVGTLGLPPPEPLGEGGPDFDYFLQGDDIIALMLFLVKPNSRRQLTTEENSKLQDLQRHQGSGECVWNPGKQIQGVTGANKTKGKAKVVRDIVLTCVLLHNMLRTHLRVEQMT